MGSTPPLLSIGDLFDDDGLFEWEDASGKMSLRLLSDGDAAVVAFGGLVSEVWGYAAEVDNGGVHVCR